MQRLACLMLAAGQAGAAQTGDPHHLLTFHGEEIQDRLGSAVAFVGDVDGDGHDDIALGATQAMTRSPGYVSVRSGALGTELYSVTGSLVTDSLGDRFGAALSTVGDVDGDGVPDFAVGAPDDDSGEPETGGVIVVSGATGTALAVALGPSAGDKLGSALSGLGDMDGDGFPDVVAGAPFGDLVRVLSGEWFATSAQGGQPLSSQVLFEARGAGRFGDAVAGLGDVNADGFPDLLVGAPTEAGVGAAHVVSGATGLTLVSLNGAEPGEWYGRAVARLGDLDQDGSDEVAVGAPFADAGGVDAGRVEVLSGEWIEQTAQGQAPSTGQVLLALQGDQAGDVFGYSVADAGDPSGDGAGDLLVGAQGGGGLANVPYGRLYSGASGTVLNTVTGDGPWVLAGWCVAGGGDASADGRSDVLVGIPHGGDGAQGSAVALSGAALALSTDTHSIDLGSGGAMNLFLEAGADRAGHFYFMLGSVSGTSPGIPTPLGTWPLVLDAYTLYTLDAPSLAEFTAFQGFLDASGAAVAQVAIPPDSNPVWTKFQIHYGYATFDAGLPSFPWTSLSNSVPMHFTIDECVTSNPALDCNLNLILDSCDIEEGTSLDCNGNGVPDECEISAGQLTDLDHDGIADECTNIVYVDAAATGDGSGVDWANARTDLAPAMLTVPPYTQVWVAKGTYRPTAIPGLQTATFPIRDRVGVYGGFAGGETSLAQRDFAANPTILTGDLLGDDGPDFLNYADNALTVVSASDLVGSTGRLDGFTVRGGNADYIVACDQYAIYFNNCRGGGLYTLGDPTIRNCVFEENYGGHHGGAVYTLRSPLFVDCVFRRNAAIRGGGVYHDMGASPRYVNCVFEENDALEGGALYLAGAAPVQPVLVNCRLNGNHASSMGGAVYTQSVRLLMLNCTLTNNSSLGSGGGLLGESDSVTRILNSVLWGNFDSSGASESAQATGGGITVHYSCVQGLSSLPGLASTGADPLFLDLDGADGIPGNQDDDLALLSGSPCVDSGNDLMVVEDAGDLDLDGDVLELTPYDIRGADRMQDDPGTPDTGVPQGQFPVVDRGAYEL